MKKSEASFTAEISVMYRAVESLKPESRRVCSDHFAKEFLRKPLRWILKNRYVAEFALWFCIERRFPGAIGTHLARVRLIDEVFTFITQNSGRKSAIVFDYMQASFIKDENLSGIVKKVRSWHQKKEEPLTFGIEAENITSFLYKRGFSKVNSFSHHSLKKAYFKDKNQYRPIYPFWRIVHAIV